MRKHRSDNVESNALWSICMYTYLRNIGPHFFMVSFFSQKLECWQIDFDGFFALAYSSHLLWPWPLEKTWYHHTSLSSTPLSQGLPILPDIFLRKGIIEPTVPCIFIFPPAWSCPKYLIRVWDEAIWRKIWFFRQGVVFMQNFWNFKAIPDTEIISTSIQSKLISKKFKWFLWRGFQKWWKLFVLLLLKMWSDIWLVKKVSDLIWGFQRISVQSIHFICMNNDLVRMRKHCLPIQIACLWSERAWLGT